MGTLYEQPERDYRHVALHEVISDIKTIKTVAKEGGITFDQALRVFELMETKRRNDLFVDNGDIWDEQIAGIGMCIDKLTDAICAVGE